MNINNAHPFYITNHLLICLLHYQQSIWPSTYPRGVQYKLFMCFFGQDIILKHFIPLAHVTHGYIQPIYGLTLGVIEPPVTCDDFGKLFIFFSEDILLKYFTTYDAYRTWVQFYVVRL